MYWFQQLHNWSLQWNLIYGFKWGQKLGGQTWSKQGVHKYSLDMKQGWIAMWMDSNYQLGYDDFCNYFARSNEYWNNISYMIYM